MRDPRMADERLAHLRAKSGDDIDNPSRDASFRRNAASSTMEAEVNSDGLITAVQPAASAGASFQLVSVSGEFHGVMIATTPLAS